MSPAAERLRHILGDDDNTPTPTLFTEMDTLQHEGGELEWKESARYTCTNIQASNLSLVWDLWSLRCRVTITVTSYIKAYKDKYCNDNSLLFGSPDTEEINNSLSFNTQITPIY